VSIAKKIRVGHHKIKESILLLLVALLLLDFRGFEVGGTFLSLLDNLYSAHLHFINNNKNSVKILEMLFKGALSLQKYEEAQ
jgi:hypothetical protein